MSDRMSVTEAQAYLDTWSTGDSVDMWKTRAARTVVVQAGQINRLQELVEHVLYYSTGFASGLIPEDIILSGDMEPPA